MQGPFSKWPRDMLNMLWLYREEIQKNCFFCNIQKMTVLFLPIRQDKGQNWSEKQSVVGKIHHREANFGRFRSGLLMDSKKIQKIGKVRKQEKKIE